jgi:hypothetical protein
LFSPPFPHYVGTFDTFLWQFFIAPLGIPGCTRSPQLIPDLDERDVLPSKGAQPIPLSCFDHLTGKIDPDEAKRVGFDSAAKPSLTAKYEAIALSCRTRFLARGELGFRDVRSLVKNHLSSAALSKRLSAALAGIIANRSGRWTTVSCPLSKVEKSPASKHSRASACPVKMSNVERRVSSGTENVRVRPRLLSTSTRHTDRPFRASAAATLIVVVVFPTPPFWFPNAMSLPSGGRAIFKISELTPPSWAGGFLPSYPYTHGISAVRMREGADLRNGEFREARPSAVPKHLAHIPIRVRSHLGNYPQDLSLVSALPMWVCGYCPLFPLTHMRFVSSKPKLQHSESSVPSYIPSYPHTHCPAYPYTHRQIIRWGTPGRMKQGFKCFKFARGLRNKRRKQRAENQNQGTKNQPASWFVCGGQR